MFEKLLFLLSFWRRQFNTYVKIVAHRTHGIHRILLRMLLRKSAPSACNNSTPPGISENSCPFVAQKKYE